MNRHIFFLILNCLSIGFSSDVFAQENYVQEFGVTKGDSIEKGVIFLDGKYINAPYTVSRKGLALYINDQEIKYPRRHMETPILIGDTSLSQLSQTEREKLFRSLEATKAIYEKNLNKDYGYIFSSNGGHLELNPYTIAYKLPSIIKMLNSDMPRSEKLQELQSYNWHLYIDIELLVDNISFSNQLTKKLSSLSEELLKIDEYGTGPTISVNKGYVFIDGRYIDLPYTLQRRGLGVYLNGKLIGIPPSSPEFSVSGDSDVLLPKSVNGESSWLDDEVRGYLANKHRYLTSHYNEEESRKLMKQVMQDLPFVTEVKQDDRDSNIVYVKTTEGMTIPCSLAASTGRSSDAQRNHKESIDKTVVHYKQILERGACYIISGTTGKTILSHVNLHIKLPTLVEVLNSSESFKSKQSKIKQVSDAIPERVIRSFIGNFKDNTQLNSRIKELKSKSNPK